MNSRNAKKAFNSTEGLDAFQSGDRRVRGLLRSGEARLRRARADSPRLCAEMLLAHSLGCDRIALIRRSNEAISADQAALFDGLISRREAREPVQQIVGHTEFWSLRINCDSRALIPRPETELLVELAVDLLKGKPSPFIADIGTGAGCIAIALAGELPEAHIFASDVSRDALCLAAQNLAEHRLAQRVRLLEGDLAAPFLALGLEGRLDAIACNPPYVADSEILSLGPEVREHEPALALFGGSDGLRFIRRLLAETAALLKPSGHLIVEIGDAQAGRVRAMADDSPSGWRVVRSAADDAGIERALLIQRENR